MTKWILALTLSVATLASLSNVHAAPASPQHGTILDMQPIDNRGGDETQGTTTRKKLGRFFGGIVGSTAMIKSSEVGGAAGQVGAVASTAAPEAGENLAKKMGSEGPAAHYMVKIQTDSGRVLTLVKEGAAVQGLKVGSKVAINGSGNDTLLVAE
ncbi:MAG: hypothetical protein ABWX83_16055 [Luteibacter sp.]